MGDHDLPKGDCILFATADWDEPYWTNKQHTARMLAKMGWRVLYVESVGLRAPRAQSRKDWKRLWARLRKGIACLMGGAPVREEGLWVMSPLAIPAAHDHPWLGWINKVLLNAGLKTHIKRHGFNQPLIWTYHPYMLLAIKGIEHSSILYHCVDDLAAVPGVDAIAFREAEKNLLKKCKVVFATAQSLADRCREINPNTHFLPNVVDAEHFGKALLPGPIPDDLATIPEPRLCYHGVLSDFKIDFALLYECAKSRPDWQWILIGEEREGQHSEKLARLVALPNVHHLGYRNYESLPYYLRGMQAGLLPSQINEYTHSMFPMKYYEFLAAGLPIISTNLAFTEKNNDGLCVANNAGEFINCIEKQLAQCRPLKEDLLQSIGKNTWHARTKRMLASLSASDCIELI